VRILINQANFFGPFPAKFAEIADEERIKIVNGVHEHVRDSEIRKPFRLAADKELTVEDMTFLCKIMKLDPRDRPTARELLEDEWFDIP
jgi:casein kinase II subunit alpha